MANQYATWNPGNKGASVALSGGNLTITDPGDGWSPVRSTIGKSSGKWYWEFTVTSGSGNNVLPGIVTSSFSTADGNYVGQDTLSWCWHSNAGLFVHNAGNSGSPGTFTVGDVIGVALDMDAGTIEFFKNNTSVGVAYTGLSGTLYPAVSHYNASTSTTNFGATTMTYTAPTGFNQGLYNVVTEPAGTYATWDHSYKSSDLTLSNGNLTVTDGADGSFSVTRGIVSKSTGKWYWEVKVDGGEPNINLGICNSSLGINDNPTAANAYCYFASGNFFYNNSNLQSVASYTTGDIIGIAYNADAGEISFYKNNVLQGTTITGVTGTWFPMWESYRPTSIGTVSFMPSTMTYTAPIGFNQGLYRTGNTYAVWNPADKEASISLSGGNLIAGHDGSTSFASVRSTIGKSSGKWYWEITDTADDGAFGMFVAVANSSASLADNWYLGQDASGWGYANRSGGGASKYNNNVRTVYGTIYTTGDIVGVALDMDAGTVEMYVNNVSQGVIYTGLTGTIFAGVSTPQPSSVVTANFGESPMTYTAPTGFNQGLYDAVIGTAEVLVVAGGGGGGAGTGGGGGAGGLLHDATLDIYEGANSVTVGLGGDGCPALSASELATNGGDSVFGGLTAIGGGRGVWRGGSVSGSGGCGGGTCDGGSLGTASQGFIGGTYSSSPFNGGGGGGMGEVGGNGIASGALTAGKGGDGLSYNISGTPTYYAGGGAGGPDDYRGGVGNSGGLGGGGVSTVASAGGNGTDGLGGGGAGGANNPHSNGGNGGDGVVIISYETDGSDGISTDSTGGTITTSGSRTIHTFTSSGTFTAVASGGGAPTNTSAGFFAFFNS